ncbi:multidrug resistance protein [Burkholderia pseudomallei]|nr:multidrug resistance protein [Burkholderia pseudomallei]
MRAATNDMFYMASVTWWDNRATYHYAVVSQAVTRASENTQRYVDALHAMGLHGARELSSLHQVVRQQAYMMATNDMFYMASVTWWDNRATYHYAVVSQAVTRASENTQRYVDALHAMGLPCFFIPLTAATLSRASASRPDSCSSVG